MTIDDDPSLSVIESARAFNPLGFSRTVHVRVEGDHTIAWNPDGFILAHGKPALFIQQLGRPSPYDQQTPPYVTGGAFSPPPPPPSPGPGQREGA